MEKNCLDLSYWEQLSCTPRVPVKIKGPRPHRDVSKIYLNPEIYLTRREAQSVLYLLKFKKRKFVADRLQLSIRTIDAYVDAVKKKLGCRSQKEMLNQIVLTDFFKNVSSVKL
jgi:DNA-binding CsgD family transcriptional regulator